MTPQLSGRHPEPVRLCEEHSRRVNGGSGEEVIAGSSSSHRAGFDIAFQEASAVHRRYGDTHENATGSCNNGLVARDLMYREK